LTHLVLGRIRKLHGQFQRLTSGILVTLLLFISGVVTQEWLAEASEITKGDCSKVQMGAPIETDFSLQSSRALIPFTPQKSSNASTASQYAIPMEPQGFSREPYDHHTLQQTENTLGFLASIALRQVGHAPT
jgi:hypothetical protein